MRDMAVKLLVIGLGGALGAIARYGAGGLVCKFAKGVFPWGTLGVNLLGCFVIGVAWALFEEASVSPNVKAFVLIGLLGAFTTFSTFSMETFKLLGDRQYAMAFANVAVSCIAGVALVFAGIFASRELVSLMK